MDGSFISPHLSAPSYILSNHLFTANYFFISIKLCFPNRSSIFTYAMIDSGATTSCISDSFATCHSLSQCLKNVPVPIIAVDDRPIASGLITQDVLTNTYFYWFLFRKSGSHCHHSKLPYYFGTGLASAS